MIKLRSYKNKDVVTLVDMLTSLKDTKLKDMIISGGSTENTESTDIDYDRVGALVIDVLSECWQKCGNKLVAWFADLNEMSEKDYLDADESILDTIEAIATRKESKDFFSRAWQLFRTINK